MDEKPTLTCRLKILRQAQGLSQQDLANATGLTRQAIGSIEAGMYIPNTAVALSLARLLRCRVEDLFVDDDVPKACALTVVGGPPRVGQRVSVAKIRGALLGFPLLGSRSVLEGFESADGLIESSGGTVRLLTSPDDLERTALLLGCDPAFGILGGHVRRRGTVNLHCLFASSQRALDGLAAGEAHIAGSHLLDPVTGDCNVTQAKAALAKTGGQVIAFAEWEQGLMVARGNPLGLCGVSDLANRPIRFLNREPGSGSRVLLDECLEKAGVPPEAIAGYGNWASSHLDAARAVAAGSADAGIGLQAVAAACDLDFVALSPVRCDLVIPRDLLTHPAVAAVVEVLASRPFRDELSALPGYHVEKTGTVIADLAPAA
jgi:molybdate-binding protein/DNA-binding XRE family transcriptional regulator